MSSSLAPLICGRANTGCRAQATLDHLSRWIDSFYSRTFSYLKSPSSDDTIIFGPYCARVLLEISLTGLVGRLDTFRILFICEAQQNPQYELGKRFKAAFSWAGDVIPPDKEPHDLWSPDHEFSKISRALFSKGTDHLIWRPAINEMLDFVSKQASDQSTAELLSIDPETHVQEIKGRLSQVYSTVSKAVHWEFLSTASVIDELTVKGAIRDVVLSVSELGFVSHFASTSFASLSPVDAWDNYKALRGEMP